MIGAVVEPCVHVPRGERLVAPVDRRCGEQRVGARGLFGELGALCALEAQLELLPTRWWGLAEADRRKRVHRDLGVAQPLGKLQRALAPFDRLVRESCRRAGGRDVSVSPRQLARRRKTLEQCDRFAGRTL